jgi:hypothetical protein
LEHEGAQLASRLGFLPESPTWQQPSETSRDVQKAVRPTVGRITWREETHFKHGIALGTDLV